MPKIYLPIYLPFSSDLLSETVAPSVLPPTVPPNYRVMPTPNEHSANLARVGLWLGNDSTSSQAVQRSWSWLYNQIGYLSTCALLILQMIWANSAMAQPSPWRMVSLELQPYYMGSDPSDLGRSSSEGDALYVPLKGKISASIEETTVEQFSEFINATGLNIDAGCYGVNSHKPDASLNWKNPGFPQKPNHPVVCVSWQDAQKFLHWLNANHRLVPPFEYRLPTDAEWEFLARAGNTRATPWNDQSANACNHANVADNTVLGSQRTWRNRFPCNDAQPYTAPASSAFTPNLLGLYHTLGNVWEWTDSVAEPDATDRQPATTHDAKTPLRFLRGGSYMTHPKFVRFANKDKAPETYRSAEVGFRVVRNLP
ncbi:MAG: SUMF1/EgtB/PvdO family nonheme iron enzyme [Gammaproteobacteria bacterium]|nr:SUMF1/EgtB/PvdO family nonheme iron enzyme [Gammaproteobacteria bacterium]